MEEEDLHIIKAKIVISLNALKERLEESSTDGQANPKNAEKTYGTIARNCYIRKATVSNIFNGVSTPKSVTLIAIIEKMGYTVSDFSAEYDSISDEDAKNYKLPRVKEDQK